MSLKKWKKPFYTLLIPVGMAFVVTVFAYGYMAFMEVNATNPEAREQARHPLFAWLNAHGTSAVMWELGILGVLTVGAIGSDIWPTLKTTKMNILRQTMFVGGAIGLLGGLIANGARSTNGVAIDSSLPTWIVLVGAFVLVSSLLVRKK